MKIIHDQETIDLFIKMRDEGCTYEEIADELGCSTKTIQKYVSVLNLPRRRLDFESQKDDVIRLFNDGKSHMQISKITGLSMSCIGRNLRILGFTRGRPDRSVQSTDLKTDPDFKQDLTRPIPVKFAKPVRYRVSKYQIGGKEYVDDLTPYILYPSEKIQLEY